MPALLIEGHRGGAGGVNDQEVTFDDPDHWDESAAELYEQASRGDIGGITEPEVHSGRGFVPEQLGGGALRAFRRASTAPIVGGSVIRATNMRYPSFRRVAGGWESK